MIEINLGKYQEIAGTDVGTRRHLEAKRMRLKDKREKMTDEESLAHHILGAKGELACAIALNLNRITLPWEQRQVYWEGRINNFGGPDLGDFTQVRTRRGYKSQQIIRTSAKDHEFYFLVTWEEKNPLTFNVVGWISVPDGKKFPLRNPRKIEPAHFIPQSDLRQL